MPAGSIRCRGVCYLANQLGLPTDAVSVASYAKVRENKLSYAKAAYTEITGDSAQSFPPREGWIQGFGR